MNRFVSGNESGDDFIMYDEENKHWILTEIATGNVIYFPLDLDGKTCTRVVRVDRKIYYQTTFRTHPYQAEAFCFDMDTQQTEVILQNYTAKMIVNHVVKLGKHHMFLYADRLRDVNGNVVLTGLDNYMFIACKNDDFCVFATPSGKCKEDCALNSVQQYELYVVNLILCKKVMTIDFYASTPSRSGMSNYVSNLFNGFRSQRKMEKDYVRKFVKLYPGNILHVVGLTSTFQLNTIMDANPHCDMCEKEHVSMRYLDGCGHCSTCEECSKKLEKCRVCGAIIYFQGRVILSRQ